MRTVGIKVLKNKLSEYVRAVGAGETVLITDRDRIVAELVPPQRRRELTDDEVVDLGIREGWMRPAEVSYAEPLSERGPSPAGEPSVSFETLMADLARDREDR